MLVLDADAGLQGRSAPAAVAAMPKPALVGGSVAQGVVNTERTCFTRGQAMEMLSEWIQRGACLPRIAELRGNGQLLRVTRRVAVDSRRDRYDETLTFSFRLCLAGIPVWNAVESASGGKRRFLTLPCALATTAALGRRGLQRLLDYGQALPPSRLSLRKRLDLGVFFFIQSALR